MGHLTTASTSPLIERQRVGHEAGMLAGIANTSTIRLETRATFAGRRNGRRATNTPSTRRTRSTLPSAARSCAMMLEAAETPPADLLDVRPGCLGRSGRDLAGDLASLPAIVTGT
jgi:hypothetical protein